jgi:hypothetical protein
MKIASPTGTLGASISGILPVDSKGQGGLLGVTVDPAFATNRMVYWTFSQPVSGGNLTAVAKGKLSGDETKIENAVVIYQATPATMEVCTTARGYFLIRPAILWLVPVSGQIRKQGRRHNRCNRGWAKWLG